MPRGLRGWIAKRFATRFVRYNAKGLEGLSRPSKGLRCSRGGCTADEEAALAAVIIAGPEPERDGVCAWTRADPVPLAGGALGARPTHRCSSMTRVLRRDGIFPPEGAPEPSRDGDAEVNRRSASKKESASE